MRSRIIRPEFWSDEKLGSLSFMERLLYIGMWNVADDEGLLRASPLYLRSVIFAYDEIKATLIDEALKKLKDLGFIYVYIHEKQSYAWIIKFRVHQKIDRPQKSNNPAPRLSTEYKMAIFKRDSFKCYICGKETYWPDNSGKSLYASPDYDSGDCVPSVDHLIARASGGTDYPTNLKTACIKCNKSKSTKDLSQITIADENVRRTFDECSTNVPDQTETETEAETETETLIGASKAEKLKAQIRADKEKFSAAWRENLEFYRTKYPGIDLDFVFANVLDWIDREHSKAHKAGKGDLNLFYQRWLNKEKPRFFKPTTHERIRPNTEEAQPLSLEERIAHKKALLEQYKGRTEPRLVNAAKAIERELADLQAEERV